MRRLAPTIISERSRLGTLAGGAMRGVDLDKHAVINAETILQTVDMQFRLSQQERDDLATLLKEERLEEATAE
jgi:hypothetical protein